MLQLGIKILLILMISTSALAQTNVEQRRKQILSIIDEELGEVERLNRQMGSRNPDLLLRMAELNLEKARLIREKENKDFLDVPPAKRRKINQKRFFKKSSDYYQKANSLALRIAKNYPRYKRLGEVYYILGFNAKEANKIKTASKYLNLATKKSRDSKTKTRTQISLAEVYYNQKKYRQAIPLYEKALRNVNDKWWTKDSFNLGWCYFNVGKISKAISKMEEVYRKSKSSKFIDMRAQVERDIGLFYATGDRIDDGISFYRKIDMNFSDQLLVIAISLKEQGKFTFAEKVLDQAEKYEKSERKLSQIYIEKLILYEQFGKFDKHLYNSKRLFSLYNKKVLYKEQLAQYQFQMAKVAAILQRQAVGKTYKRLKKIRRKKADQAIEYFGMLSQIDSKKSDEYLYLQGETAYAVGQFSGAYSYYKRTYQKSSRTNSSFKPKALDAMIATLGALKAAPTANTIYVFEEYLKNYPKGSKSKAAYIRLFNNYKKKKDYKNASLVLDRFVKHYPEDKSQEAMIAELMEVSRKERDHAAIRKWINEIEAGKYKVSAKYRAKLQELLTSIQIDDVQKQLSSGNKKTALLGYLKILDDPYATKRSKVNAKYNLAALYFELGDTDNTHKWAKSALQEMDSKDVYKFSASFITMSNFLFSSLEFMKSSDLSQTLVSKLCSKKSGRKNTAFKNAAFIYLADGHIQKAEGLVREAKKCRIPSAYIDEVEYEIMREYFLKRNWNRYEYYVLKLKDSNRVYNKVIDDLLNLISVHLRFSNKDKVAQFNKILWSLYYKAKKSKDVISMRGLDYFATIKLKSMEETINQLRLIQYEFPLQKLMSLQAKKDALLKKLSAQSDEVFAVGSGVGIVNAYKLLYEAFMGVAKEVKDFYPKGLSAEDVKKVKQQFSAQVGAPAKAAAKLYMKQARQAIANNSILNKNNFFFQNGDFSVEFHGEKNAILMDRGGKQ